MVNLLDEIEDEEDKINILKDYHDSRFGGHFGVEKRHARLKRKFYWRGMKSYIRRYINICRKCQKYKQFRFTKMPLTITTVAQRPFEKNYIDIVGPHTNLQETILEEQK